MSDKHTLTLATQAKQARMVKKLTAHNAQLRAELEAARAKLRPPASHDSQSYVVGRYEVSFHWRNLDEYRNREKRNKMKANFTRLTPTQVSMINRGYIHRGRLMLFRLPFDSWRSCVKIGKGLRRSREA